MNCSQNTTELNLVSVFSFGSTSIVQSDGAGLRIPSGSGPMDGLQSVVADVNISSGGSSSGSSSRVHKTDDVSFRSCVTRRFWALLSLALLPTSWSLAFCPADRNDRLWDTWLYRNTDPNVKQSWVLNYLVKHHEPVINGAQGWNAANTAVSDDGVHFVDLGVSIQHPCDCDNATLASTCVTNMGSSSIWRNLKNGSEWIMAAGTNLSDPSLPPGTNCGVLRNASDPTSADPNATGIFFSVSSDLVNWRSLPSDGYPGATVFRAGVAANGGDPSLYPPQFGSGDCIAVLPRPATDTKPAGYCESDTTLAHTSFR